MENKNILLIIISVSGLFVIILFFALIFNMPNNSQNSTKNGSNVTEHNGNLAQPASSNDIRTQNIGIGFQDSSAKPTTTPSFTLTLTTSSAGLTQNPDKTIEPGLIPSSINKNGEVLENPYLKNTKAPAKNIVKNKTTVPKATATVTLKVAQRITHYWIQAGSFKSRNSAEALNKTISDKGFYGQIQTFEDKGATFYRVRIGPYLDKSEANKFLDWVKAIKGMEDSFVSKVYGVE